VRELEGSSHRLRRIAVLGDEVAGVASEHEILDFALPALAESDHFPDPRKMIGSIMASGFAGSYRIIDDLAEILPFRVAKYLLKISGQPKFQAGFELGLDEFFQLGKKLGDNGFLHCWGFRVIFPRSGK
jgi:hypothetical protein